MTVPNVLPKPEADGAGPVARGARDEARWPGGLIGLILSRPVGTTMLAALAAAMIVLSAATAYVVSALGETVYGGRAEVLFDRDSEAFFEGARDMETQKELLKSGVVLGPVAERAGMSVDDLADDLSVEVKGESDVLRLTVAHPDRASARELAGSIASSYVLGLAVPSSNDRARVVTPAYALEEPVAPRPLRSAAAAGLIALLIMGGLVVALTHPRLRR